MISLIQMEPRQPSSPSPRKHEESLRIGLDGTPESPQRKAAVNPNSMLTVGRLNDTLARAGVMNFEAKTGTSKNEEVAIALGDMTRIEAAAYVVPHFNGGMSWGGVGAAVARGGASRGMQEYESFVEGHRQQKWGDANSTLSGGGNARHLIHVVSVGSGREQEFSVVRETTFNALRKAYLENAESIVFPALGTGIIGQLTADQSARAIFEGIERFRKESPDANPKTITIAIYGDPNAYRDFVRVMQASSVASGVNVTPVAAPTPASRPTVAAAEVHATGGASATGSSNLQDVERRMKQAGMTVHANSALVEPGTNHVIAVGFGDMTKIPADAYVVPQFSGATSFGGVGAAVVRGGARRGMEEYDRMASTLTAWGTATATASGSGSAKDLIHVVSVGSGEREEFNVVREATKNALIVAQQRGDDTVVFPAMGTGIIGRLTADQSARAMLVGIAEYRRENLGQGPTKIIFAIYGDSAAYQQFLKAINSGASTPSVSAATPSSSQGEVGRREFDLGRWVGEMDRDWGDSAMPGKRRDGGNG